MAKKVIDQKAALNFINVEPDPAEPEERSAPATHDQESKALMPEGIDVPANYRIVPALRSERVQLLLTKYLKTELRRIAAERGLSLNDLANKIFEDYVKGESK